MHFWNGTQNIELLLSQTSSNISSTSICLGQHSEYFIWSSSVIKSHDTNTLRPRQNGCHLPDDIFKWIFLNENVWISINISLKFVPRGPINSIPTLVQVMAWRRPGDKSLSEPMMVRLPTHICVTRPQWVNCNASSLHSSILTWSQHTVKSLI